MYESPSQKTPWDRIVANYLGIDIQTNRVTLTEKLRTGENGLKINGLKIMERYQKMTELY